MINYKEEIAKILADADIGLSFDGEHNGKPRLKYYFDISDTHEARFPRPVPLWTVREEYADDHAASLARLAGSD